MSEDEDKPGLIERIVEGVKDLFDGDDEEPEVLTEEDLDGTDPADHDDAEDTDHLGRLADPEVLARVEEIEREQPRWEAQEWS